MTDRECLEGVREKVLELRELDRLLLLCPLDGRPQGAKNQRYDGSSHGTNAPTAAAVQLYEGIEARRMAAMEQLEGLSAQLGRIINCCQDATAMVIIARYYGMGHTDEEIGRDMNLSRSFVNATRLRAVKDL